MASGRGPESFEKRQREKRKQQKRLQKLARRKARSAAKREDKPGDGSQAPLPSSPESLSDPLGEPAPEGSAPAPPVPASHPGSA
ncbi:MAG: hypothetical protein ACREIU_10975 [Planctomycetota bacterium]